MTCDERRCGVNWCGAMHGIKPIPCFVTQLLSSLVKLKHLCIKCTLFFAFLLCGSRPHVGLSEPFPERTVDKEAMIKQERKDTHPEMLPGPAQTKTEAWPSEKVPQTSLAVRDSHRFLFEYGKAARNSRKRVLALATLWGRVDLFHCSVCPTIDEMLMQTNRWDRRVVPWLSACHVSVVCACFALLLWSRSNQHLHCKQNFTSRSRFLPGSSGSISGPSILRAVKATNSLELGTENDRQLLKRASSCNALLLTAYFHV